jgi:cysteinyl-tRNA synthetase
MDSGEFAAGNATGALKFLDHFDAVFDVLRPAASGGGLSDTAIDALIAERAASKKSRNFARADEIRAELAGLGIVLEDTKDGVRWKRS